MTKRQFLILYTTFLFFFFPRNVSTAQKCACFLILSFSHCWHLIYQLDLCIIFPSIYSFLPLVSILTATNLAQAIVFGLNDCSLALSPCRSHLPKSCWRNLLKRCILSLSFLKSSNGFIFHLEYNNKIFTLMENFHEIYCLPASPN